MVSWLSSGLKKRLEKRSGIKANSTRISKTTASRRAWAGTAVGGLVASGALGAGGLSDGLFRPLEESAPQPVVILEAQMATDGS